jgi:hypothetical protein
MFVLPRTYRTYSWQQTELYESPISPHSLFYNSQFSTPPSQSIPSYHQPFMPQTMYRLILTTQRLSWMFGHPFLYLEIYYSHRNLSFSICCRSHRALRSKVLQQIDLYRSQELPPFTWILLHNPKHTLLLHMPLLLVFIPLGLSLRVVQLTSRTAATVKRW